VTAPQLEPLVGCPASDCKALQAGGIKKKVLEFVDWQ
jgi:hypothetical protein